MSLDPLDPVLEVERYELSEAPAWRFDLERREFLRIFGAMGGGLAVVISMPGMSAQESGAPGQRNVAARELGAWLHIDEQGRIAVFTGKTEIGQNIRTSLAQSVADELRVPLTAVSMVMADTDLVPYDAGTFGSQSTPRMAPQLARAAAAARELLRDRAAALWQIDKSALTVADGRVIGPQGRSVGFGDLTRGQKMAGAVSADAALDGPDAWRERGKPVHKVNGREIVTGQHRFTPDLVRPGMLFGRMIRSDGYDGTLASVDDHKARAMNGVTVVRDGDFLGVVAATEGAARRAAAAVQAKWTLPSDQPSDATIYDHLRANPGASGGRGGPSGTTSGDVERARASAARVFEARYRIPYIAHVPLEPRAAVAEWEGGRLTVWCGTQRPFGVRSDLASAFRLGEAQVRVIVPDTGSAYGGKHTGEHAIEAARLARAVGKPVKLVWTRAEEFAYGYFRPAGVIEVRAGVDASGRIVSWEFDNLNSGASAIRTPYEVANQRIQFHPSTSPLRQGSYRGLAATANHYAREMHMDAIARELKIDAVEFRLRHLQDARLRAVLTAAAEKGGWDRPSAPGRGRGIACGTEKGSYVAGLAEVSRTPGGFRVDRLVVAFECGAIVNPDGLHNQVEGAVVQGLGGALFERVEFSGGRLLNGSMEQYRVPRFRDIPPIEVVLLDRRDLPSAGAGETPIVCVAPAIGSAVRALGPVAPELPVRLV
ncbi:MAG TPA: molybdopterin cofactor-binding domain-containing protein [Vicinamibacterales bacterium]|nr:molybdopterin cofactor-binding domain-containing protein [Vicinamibacterales bacterium]